MQDADEDRFGLPLPVGGRMDLRGVVRSSDAPDELDVVEGTGRIAATLAPLFNSSFLVDSALSVYIGAGDDLVEVAGFTVHSVSHALANGKTHAHTQVYARAGATEAIAAVRATTVETRMVRYYLQLGCGCVVVKIGE